MFNRLSSIPAIESIDPLIARLKDAKGRMRLDVIYALASIFRKQEGRDPETWQRHWDSVKSDFTVDRPATLAFRKTKGQQDMQATALGFFYFLLVRSDRLVYVLDTSMSMRGERIANLKHNMKESIESLDSTVLFNVISFGGNIDIASPSRLITGGEGKGIAYLVDTLKLSPPTRSYDVIELGCLMAGIDTVMYLSDGAPICGHIEPWSGIIAAYTYLNRYRPVAIHTVEFDAGAANAAMMRQLARRNYGTSGSPDGVPEGAGD